MAPDAEDCEQVERLNANYPEVPVHQGRRILPEVPPPAQAWTENEELGLGSDSRTNSPGENRRLLGTKPLQKPSCRLQAGLTLGVWVVKKPKCSSLKSGIKTQTKTKFQKRREKLKDVLRPPYFIITMLFLIVMVHLCGPDELRSKLEWAPEAWWTEPWRLLTYGLVHAGAAHLAINALVAVTVGWHLEREQGWARVALVWLGGVAAGALGAGALQPRVRVVGASAAVYALLTAHLPNVCLRFGHIPLWWFRPLSVMVLGASEGCWALVRTPDPQLSASHVAWAAHALGAAVGVPLAFLVFTGENSHKRSVTVCRISSGLLLVMGVVAAALYYRFWYEVDPMT
ncbi:rhomboid-related protein 2 [Bicyclus anynana]|uniref:Rhomboid-related protein 2 n=1 Tax=Bicyclus anynana TaxID=110368 RepID=A0A6J1NID8_BICAN|nr:rhomboid-related protein 2 [Bicyclus anynana]XP_052737548.1 rhomboid-related protein 2 [Bicyclus anynana]XP_052737549.1 rhomboid-related protein 2 [Bicyclus anynana]